MITMPCCGHLGRLGNMMLQFAAGYGHAKRTGQDFIIPPSPYSVYLSRLNLPKWVKVTDQIPQMPKHYEEPRFAYDRLPSDLRNTSIRGYFQSFRYWDDCAEDIWRIFAGDVRKTACLGMNKIADICNPEDAVAFCVRRTDYLQPDRLLFHGVLGKPYYLPAMEQFPGKTFVCFSDDLEHCRRKYGDDPRFRFCDESDHWLKLWMIAGCAGGAIIANSTYHMWGAWFGWFLEQKRKVVWPQRWFGPMGPNDQTADVCPKEWTRI